VQNDVVFIPKSVSSRARVDPLGPDVRGEEAQFRGAEFLGQRVLRLDLGRDEAVIREYIKNQEQEDKRLDQLNLWR